MRHFSYFLFENIDLDVHADDRLNPRRFLNANTDAILSHIANSPAGSCDFCACTELFGNDMLNTLLSGGIIRQKNNCVVFDTPVFLREDAASLRAHTEAAGVRITDELEKYIPQIRDLCSTIRNGFSIEMNLYHILCGMIFDGSFFDYLAQHHAVTTSRLHASGFDYLSVIYEQCPELDSYSDGLLCSYNRFANSHCALESFGDANGSRHDFYRFFRLLESESLPEKFHTAQQLLHACGNINKNEILYHAANYVQHGRCPAPVLALLEHFGYATDGEISVPVYTAEDREIIGAIEQAVETHLGKYFIAKLAVLSKEIDITAARHGVSAGEIANELYHILFGSVNEELVRRGIVARPPFIPGEGRFFRCIQINL